MMNSKHVTETPSYGSALISRLLTLYLDRATLPESDEPLTVHQLQRLMRSIIGEGYGPAELPPMS